MPDKPTVQRRVKLNLRNLSRLSRAISIGDRWRNRSTGNLCTVVMVYRADRMALLELDGERYVVHLATLLRDYLWHADREVPA